MTALPILYSFRRCPYAMRARLALAASGQQVELREIVLRNKPEEMIQASPKATVPVLVEDVQTVRDESLDIILWALERNDPDGWLTPEIGNKTQMLELVERMDGPFKDHLDAYKYAPRPSRKNPDADTTEADARRDAGLACLMELDERLQQHRYLFGSRLSLADIAIAPIVRQFANVDTNWFAAQAYPRLQEWLAEFVGSDLFEAVMHKYEPWKDTQMSVTFPERAA